VGLPLDVQAALGTVCLWLGLALLFVGLMFVHDARRLRVMLATGGLLVVVAIVLIVGMLGFGPDYAG
jgi:hypothetical protein